MAFKTEYVLYTARNYSTGLVDVKATIRRDGTEVANNVVLAELDALNKPGVYQLTLTPALINTYGGEGFYDFYITSATQPAPALATKYVSQNSVSDVQTSVAAVATDVTTIKNNVLHMDHGLPALKTLIDSLQGSVNNIQNNTRFSATVPDEFIRPGSGSTTFKIYAQVFDTAGAPEDVDSDVLNIQLKDVAGTDINTALGLTSGPQAMTKVGTGRYSIDLSLPSGAQLRPEFLIEFTYAENGVPFTQVRASAIVPDVQQSGFATQSSVDAIQGPGFDTAQHSMVILKAALDAIEGAGFAVATDSLHQIRARIDAINTEIQGAGFVSGTDSLRQIRLMLDSGTSGLAAIANKVTASQTSVQGAGYDQATDSLRAISNRVYNGGAAL